MWFAHGHVCHIRGCTVWKGRDSSELPSLVLENAVYSEVLPGCLCSRATVSRGQQKRAADARLSSFKSSERRTLMRRHLDGATAAQQDTSSQIRVSTQTFIHCRDYGGLIHSKACFTSSLDSSANLTGKWKTNTPTKQIQYITYTEYDRIRV